MTITAEKRERVAVSSSASGLFTRSRWQASGLLAGGFMANAVTITPAVHAVFGTFLIPVTQEFGWPRAAFSLGLLIISVTAGLMYPLSGYLADRIGVRPLLALGFALFAAALANMAFMSRSMLSLSVSFLLIGICGAIPSTALLSKFISDRFRGRATALAVTAGGGNAIGCMLMPALVAAVVSAAGWRQGYLAIAGVVVVLGSISLVLLRGSYVAPPTAIPPPDDTSAIEALRGRTFWLLLLVLGFGAGASGVIFSHLVPIVAEHGVGLGAATAALSLNSFISLFAQIVSARLLDRTSSPRVVCLFYLIGALGLACVGFGLNYPVILAGVTLLGVASGMQWAAVPFLVGRYFGFRQFGFLVSWMYSAAVAAQGILPVALDATFDRFGSYRLALTGGCFACVVGAAAFCLLPSYVRSASRGGVVPSDGT